MDSLGALLAISAAIAIGAVSPGPSFVFVARRAMANGRKTALATAVGMGLAGALFASVAAGGIATVVSSVPALFIAFRILGSSYLAYIGLSMIRYSAKPLEMAEGSAKAGIWQGFKTQASNPKTIVVYASVFAALMPHSPAAWLYAALPASVGAIETAWYVVVSLLFASSVAARGYARTKKHIDRIFGCVMIVLAFKLALG
jgi:threonine/homoserine/homoserine lactone efflux protein